MVSCLSVIRGRVGQLGARSLSAVRNEEASARGRLIKHYSSVVISFGATASVRYREVVRPWEGPLWEVPLYKADQVYWGTIWNYAAV